MTLLDTENMARRVGFALASGELSLADVLEAMVQAPTTALSHQIAIVGDRLPHMDTLPGMSLVQFVQELDATVTVAMEGMADASAPA